MKNNRRKGRAVPLAGALGAILLSLFSLAAGAESVPAALIGENVKISSRYCEEIFGTGKEVSARPHEEENGEARQDAVLLGGHLFGIKMKEEYPTVVSVSPEVDGLAPADRILSVNGTDVHGAGDVLELLRPGENEIAIKRGDKTLKVTVEPKYDGQTLSLGITLRDAIGGIGTVSFILPETGEFGGLGHGIGTPGDASDADPEKGQITSVALGGVKRGESGTPGELRGVLKRDVRGDLYANTEVGVFGQFDAGALPTCERIGTARPDEIREGPATLYSTVHGGERACYTVEIHPLAHEEGRNKSFRVRVTDEDLIALTGGIVRGMSGSPIVQDGKLIGALTHVSVADPTEGYGIYIDNMIEELSDVKSTLQKNAA